MTVVRPSDEHHEYEYDTTPREFGGKPGCRVCGRESRHPVHRTSNGNNDLAMIRELIEAASAPPVEWGTVTGKNIDQLVDDFRASLSWDTAVGTNLHGVYLKGCEAVVCHTGNGPHSEANAKMIDFALNNMGKMVDEIERLRNKAHAHETRGQLRASEWLRENNAAASAEWQHGWDACLIANRIPLTTMVTQEAHELKAFSCVHIWSVIGPPRDPEPEQFCDSGCGLMWKDRPLQSEHE